MKPVAGGSTIIPHAVGADLRRQAGGGHRHCHCHWPISGGVAAVAAVAAVGTIQPESDGLNVFDPEYDGLERWLAHLMLCLLQLELILSMGHESLLNWNLAVLLVQS